MVETELEAGRHHSGAGVLAVRVLKWLLKNGGVAELQKWAEVVLSLKRMTRALLHN